MEHAWSDRIYPPDWRAWADPDVPDFFSPTGMLLDRHLEAGDGDRTALRVDRVAVTYAQLHAAVCRAAHGLVEAGLRPEARILLFGTDSLEFLACWLAAVRVGAVPAVVSDRYPPDRLRYFLEDTGCSLLFIDEEQLPKLAEIRDVLPPALGHVLVRRAGTGSPALSAPVPAAVAATPFDDLVEQQPRHHAPVSRHANDVAYMFYSGGTTGTAKGIVHLAHDFVLVPERQGAFWSYSRDDVCHATSKKYFTHGLWPGVLMPLYQGATGVLRRESPTAEQVIDLVEQERPTVLVTVPTVVKLLLAHATAASTRPDFGSVRLLVSASEKMPDVLFERFADRFGVEVLDSMGSSEVTYEWLANRPGHARRGSVGKPVFGYEVKLVTPDGEEVAQPGQDGEAWVKSRTACLFYWRKFDQTKETFQGPWTRTGDVLQFDEDGFFWFSGRGDDLFKVRGLWVSPVEVEEALVRHEAVAEAAVIPAEEADGLTCVKAVVVLTAGFEPSAELTDAIRDRAAELGRYRAPAVVEYVDALPRTTLMKIDRRTLRERERGRHGAPR